MHSCDTATVYVTEYNNNIIWIASIIINNNITLFIKYNIKLFVAADTHII